MKSTGIQSNSLYREAGSERRGKKTCWLEWGEEVEGGGSEGASATGDGGQAAVSLTPEVDGKPVYIFEGSQCGGSYVAYFCTWRS